MIELFSLPPALHSIAVLVTALVAKYLYLLTTPQQQSFFAFYCRQLAQKVNNAQNSKQQQRIAGFLASTLTLVPMVIILWLFEAFVDIEFIWHFILLFVALGNLQLSRQIEAIAKNVRQNANYQAKEILKPIVLRDTEKLSGLGLIKAAAEVLTLKTQQQIYGVIFWYIAAGPLTALTYRIILEMHYCWNRKRPEYQHFGWWVERLTYVALWLPSRLSLAIYFICHLTSHSAVHWQLLRKDVFSLGNNVNLSLIALLNNVKLGGVAMYHQTKLRRREFNLQGQQPTVADLLKINRQLNWHNLIMLIIIGLLLVIIGIATSGIAK